MSVLSHLKREYGEGSFFWVYWERGGNPDFDPWEIPKAQWVAWHEQRARTAEAMTLAHGWLVEYLLFQESPRPIHKNKRCCRLCGDDIWVNYHMFCSHCWDLTLNVLRRKNQQETRLWWRNKKAIKQGKSTLKEIKQWLKNNK